MDSTTKVQNAALTPEQIKLMGLQADLAQRQLDQIDQLAPYQKQLLDYARTNATNQSKYQQALDAAITPEDQAAAQAAQFKATASLAPIQQQMAQMQLDALKQGGRATDQQKSDIAAATDASIAAGTGDINTQTQRGIGMISDQLANARGLRLSDSPIGAEAGILTRAGNDQIASLTNNLRANQANATLNYPLAVQGLMSGVNTNASGTNQAAQQFQAQLQQMATQNRASMTGAASGLGLGLSGIGTNGSGMNYSAGSSSSKGPGIMDYGMAAYGIGSLINAMGTAAAA
jgi:hypothetical protein